MKALKLIPAYLKQYLFVIIAFVVFFAIFAFIAYLYGFAAEAVLYSFLLCNLVAAVFAGVHFALYCKRHAERRRLLQYPETAALPAPRSPAERDYIEVIEKLRETIRGEAERYRAERAEYADYYGSWIHQIKTPIAAMGLILQEEDTPSNRELSQELFRIEQYAEMALWYLRMDNISDLVLQSCDIDEIVRDAVRKYAPVFIRKKLSLQFTPSGEVAVTDKKWLTFILEQLLSNAVKYTERGSVTVTVRQKVISVSDTGIGISRGDLPRIFERGYTGYNGRTERRSTGIGLYLCKRAADKLSHGLSADSEEGKGSTFRVDLNSYPLKAE